MSECDLESARADGSLSPLSLDPFPVSAVIRMSVRLY
jgi:hypothetical protein